MKNNETFTGGTQWAEYEGILYKIEVPYNIEYDVLNVNMMGGYSMPVRGPARPGSYPTLILVIPLQKAIDLFGENYFNRISNRYMNVLQHQQTRRHFDMRSCKQNINPCQPYDIAEPPSIELEFVAKYFIGFDSMKKEAESLIDSMFFDAIIDDLNQPLKDDEMKCND